MKRIFCLAILSVLYFAAVSFAQENGGRKLFEVKGIIKDQNKSVLAGLNLYFVGADFKETFVTDENGAFLAKIPVGKYTITVNKATSKKFIAFIEIPKDKHYPTDFEMIVETNPTCCSQTSDGKTTEIIKYVAPPYPPAARAVHASGEVVVAVKIDKDGKVVSAEALSGHPLLKKAAVQAAKLWLFSPDENSAEREGQIVFAFVPLGNSNGAVNFTKPNRLEIFGKSPTVDY